MSDRLFTPRFLIMFGYSFTVFVSVFQLLPAAPYRVLDLGGSMAAAGLFHGCLTYASAIAAPFTGPICDRIGHRTVLIVVSLLLTFFTASYAFIPSYKVMFLVVFVHGFIWSALLAASGAYMTASIPAGRRAEGIAYWGLASVLAIGSAPALGFWVYRHGWGALCTEIAVMNLLMAVIAWTLPDDRAEAASARAEIGGEGRGLDGTDDAPLHERVEWRVLGLSIVMTLITFGYGSLTSFAALFADELGVSPRSLYLTVMAAAILLGQLTIGRMIDNLGHRRVLVRCLLVPAVGLLLLAAASGRLSLIFAATVYGAGFSLMYPSYTAYIINHVPPKRRGAAFGAMLAAFDAGIGSGASIMGWLIHAYGFRIAYVVAAALAALSLPYFLLAERRLGFEARRALESARAT